MACSQRSEPITSYGGLGNRLSEIGASLEIRVKRVIDPENPVRETD